MHITTIIAAIIALAGALVVLKWMPGLQAADAAPVEVGDASPAELDDLVTQTASVEG